MSGWVEATPVDLRTRMSCPARLSRATSLPNPSAVPPTAVAGMVTSTFTSAKVVAFTWGCTQPRAPHSNNEQVVLEEGG